MNLQVHPSQGLQGERSIPGDKSVSHRSLMIGALAEGVSRIQGLSNAADVQSTQACLEALGVEIDNNGSETIIHGKGPRGFRKPSVPLHAGNSGTTMRLLSGILSGQRFDSTIVGDASLSKRPMKRIIEPLRLMGANISGTADFTAPLQIASTYSLRPIEYELNLPSAQVKSAILFAALYADGVTRLLEETPTRDHTERMLGLTIQSRGTKRSIEVKGGQKVPPRNGRIPGDISAATFLIAAASIVPGSQLTIRNVGLNKTRTAVFDIFRNMNVFFEIRNEAMEGGEETGDIVARSSDVHSDITLKGETVALLIDEIPMLAVLAVFGKGTFTLRDATELRHKESDRIAAIVQNLRALGIDVTEFPDGFAFQSKKGLIGRELDSYGDHRIAMAFGVAGLRIPGITIRDAECVDISFPGFWKAVGA
jgi:3-phosphoshikimate 1-carboxyvinyltransferase